MRRVLVFTGAYVVVGVAVGYWVGRRLADIDDALVEHERILQDIKASEEAALRDLSGLLAEGRP